MNSDVKGSLLTNLSLIFGLVVREVLFENFGNDIVYDGDYLHEKYRSNCLNKIVSKLLIWIKFFKNISAYV